MKICIKCKQKKELSEFPKRKDSKDRFRNECKICINKISLDWCRKHKYKHQARYRIKNKDIILSKIKKYKNLNKEKIKNTNKLYYINNKNKILNYRIKNIVNYNKWRSIYRKNLYENNSIYKLSVLLRSRFKTAIKKNYKSASVLKLIGCSIEQLKEHLQQTAIKNGYSDFDINTYSGKEYHIDHIIPIDSFNLKCSYHQKLCFNYLNTQILESKENILKSNK